MLYSLLSSQYCTVGMSAYGRLQMRLFSPSNNVTVLCLRTVLGLCVIVGLTTSGGYETQTFNKTAQILSFFPGF